jgi:superfamily II DNA/RNA helicase
VCARIAQPFAGEMNTVFENLREKLAFKQFLPVQKTVMPILFDTIESARKRGFHRDCLIAAPTGSKRCELSLLL